jgi:outer membrane protein TolC
MYKPGMKLCCLCLLLSGMLRGEVHKLSLQEALQIALRQNPDAALARLDAFRAQHDIEIAGNVFSPKVNVRGDAVYTNGYPNAIGPDAHSPSIIHQQTDMALYNRPQRYQIAAARQDAEGAKINAAAKPDDVANRIASLYLDVEEAGRQRASLEGEVQSDKQMADATSAKVNSGYALPVELLRGKVQTEQTLQRLHALDADREYTESLLAVALGFSGNDSIEPAEPEENFNIPVMKSPEAAVNEALLNSKDLQRLESNMLARRLERKSFGAFRIPQIDLVEQYSLFAERTYQDYFSSSNFQRNNAELGASFTLPILIGPEPGARMEQADIDEEKLEVQISDLVHRIRANIERSLDQLQKAETALNVARQSLDLAHDETGIAQAQYGEGRSLPSDVEGALTTESEKQLAVVQCETDVQRMKLDFLRQLGKLMNRLSANH